MGIPLSLSTLSKFESLSWENSEGTISLLLNLLALIGKRISQDLKKAGLNHLTGTTGQVNVQGEQVQKLDEWANQIFLEMFETQELVSTLVSEEMEKPYFIKQAEGKGRLVLFFDPLDGSSNTDINGSLGSIFSVHLLSHPGYPSQEHELFRKGTEQILAGYFLYGPSTLLVVSVGKGVLQFILDPEIGDFFLASSSIRIPRRGNLYSVNEGNREKWDPGVQKFLTFLQNIDSQTGRPYSGRYSGCLVADFHRILCKGGIYLYPADPKNPEGKLRLMYEAAPLSFVMEQAGGRGSTGILPVVQVMPERLHQRVPLFIGSQDDVSRAEEFLHSG